MINSLISQAYAEGLRKLVAPKYIEEFGSELFWNNVSTEYKKIEENERIYTVKLGKKFLGELHIRDMGEDKFEVEFIDKVYKSEYGGTTRTVQPRR